MKKVIFALGFIGILSGKCFSAQDKYGSIRPPVWRSSYTATVDINVNISSTEIHFHGVVVGSPSISGNGGQVLIFDATTFTLPNFSTIAWITTDVGEPIRVFDIVLSTGLSYRKDGNAAVNILWEYLSGIAPGRRR